MGGATSKIVGATVKMSHKERGSLSITGALSPPTPHSHKKLTVSTKEESEIGYSQFKSNTVWYAIFVGVNFRAHWIF